MERPILHDSCTYALHLPRANIEILRSSTSSSLSSSSLDLDSDASLTSALAAVILSRVDSLCSRYSYVWARDAFNLAPASSSQRSHPGYISLRGSSRLAESVTDEWFILYLLLELSKQQEDFPGLICEVRDDDDGQFALIEAAEVLPRWLTPDNAENRFWISNGQFHLISIEKVSRPSNASAAQTSELNSSGYLSAQDALPMVASPSMPTLAPPEVSSVILSRLQASGIPDHLRDTHLHDTAVYLPTTIKTLIERSPQSLTEAIATFIDRDPFTLKSCQNMSNFLPLSTATDKTDGPIAQIPKCRDTLIHLTRPLYAQLVTTKFYPPKPFVKAGWFPDSLAEDSAEYRRRDLGMKIACGFEMLYVESGKSRYEKREEGDRKQKEKAYLTYLVQLQNVGYFQGETAGSRLYTELEEKAQEYWQSMKEAAGLEEQSQPADKQASSRNRSSRSALYAGMRSILEEQETTLDRRSASEPREDLGVIAKEDSDAWLYLDQSGLDNLLSRNSSKPATIPSAVPADGLSNTSENDRDEDEELANEQAKRLQAIADKFGNFVDGQGDMEGALFDDDAISSGGSDTSDSDEDRENTMDVEENVAGPNKASKGFSEAEKAEKLENLVDPLDVSEWGAEAAKKAKAIHTVELPEVVQSSAAEYSGEAAAQKNRDRIDRTSQLEKEHYDGASDSSSDSGGGAGEPSSVSQSRLKTVGIDDDNDDDESPLIVDDEGLKFGPGEMQDFLDFTRQALGLTPEQYNGIVEGRKKRGAFVPDSTPSAKAPSSVSQKTKASNVKPKKEPVVKASAPSASARAPPANKSESGGFNPSFRNPKLDSFEALMNAMDAELSRVKTSHSSPSTSVARETSKPIRKSNEGVEIHDEVSSDEAESDEEVNMEDLDAELAAALKRAPGDPVVGWCPRRRRGR